MCGCDLCVCVCVCVWLGVGCVRLAGFGLRTCNWVWIVRAWLGLSCACVEVVGSVCGHVCECVWDCIRLIWWYCARVCGV